MRSPANLGTALARIKRVTVRRPWWRVVAFRHLLKSPAQPPWAAGSKVEGARLTPKDGFDSLYLAGDPVTALAPLNSLVLLPGGPISIPSPPCTLLAGQGVVSRVLDLTHADTLTTLGTTAEEMTAPWILVTRPPTQVLAQAAYDCGRVAGIRYGSAKHHGRKNLVVFTDRLQSAPGDFLEVHDPEGHLTQRIGANRVA